jgi:hypothetical protein
MKYSKSEITWDEYKRELEENLADVSEEIRYAKIEIARRSWHGIPVTRELFNMLPNEPIYTEDFK